MNQRYGKIDPNDSSRVIYAANGGVYNGRLYPTFPDAVQRALGNLPIEPDTPPSDPAPEGYHWEAREWSVVRGQGSAVSGLGEDDASTPETRNPNPETRIRRVYVAVQDPPPPPRRWSRLSIKTALAQAEILAAVRTFLGSVEIATGYTAWEALTDCDYIEEGYPDATKWNAILNGAAQALGKTRAEIDAFLAQIPTEGGI